MNQTLFMYNHENINNKKTSGIHVLRFRESSSSRLPNQSELTIRIGESDD